MSRKNEEVMLLLDIPKSKRHFWKDTHKEHVSLRTAPGQVADKSSEGTNNLPLTANQIMAMALNEYVVEHAFEAECEGGFFYHFPSRETLMKVGSNPDTRTCGTTG